MALVAALLFLSAPAAVEAAYTSTVVGSTATMTGDAAGDTLTITALGAFMTAPALFYHNRFTAGDPGFSSDFDFDSTVAGTQTLSGDTGIININAGDANDTIAIEGGSSLRGTVNVNAGDGNDTIAIASSTNLRGTIDGGPGVDTIDYSAWFGSVGVNLGLGTTGLAATLRADQENLPTTHPATGTTTVTNYNINTHKFDITVTVTDLLPADVTGFHLHQGAVGVNGPIIVDFGPPGALIAGGTGFTFTATGLTVPAVNEAGFLGGGTYVDVHTAAFPGGAIRGQLFSGGNVNLTTGATTGAASVTNVENATGGREADSLVGSFAVNTLSGGAGADWIVGGPGNDTLRGDAGADVLVWSNGDGTDVDEGGADADTVQVNGNVASVDVFTMAANGPRIRFDRTNVGLFSLDIGTTETLIVNGIGGDDSFTVNDLTGVASLTALNLNGFDGNDLFTFVAASAGAVLFDVHGGAGTDTLQGPNADSTWNVTAANLGNLTGLVNSFRFVEALTGGTASDSFNVKAFTSGTQTVTGGSGADTLNYNAESRAVSGDTLPPDGVIDSPGVQSVAFSQIETVNLTNPQPLISINDVTVPEGGAPTSAVFTVTLSNPSLVPVTVSFITANGTATAPGDYTAQTGTLTFAAGETLKTIAVPITVDAVPEPTETFVVFLFGAGNAVIADPQGVGTITDNDVSSLSIDDVTGLEGQAAAVFTITLTPASIATVSVNFATSNGTALAPGDYSTISGTLTFTPGQTSRTIFVPITNDALPEAPETFVVNLSVPVNATIADAQAQGTIIDDDRGSSFDPNGDGKGDALLYNVANGAYAVQVNNGMGSFASSTAFWDPGWQVYPVNLNTDIYTDVFLYNPASGVWVQARNNAGDGTFAYTSGRFDPDWQIYPADLDGDAITDIFVYNVTTGLWAKCLINGSGDFSNFTFGQWDPAWTLITADLNGDGRDDFHLYNRTSGVFVQALSQAGLGTFDYPAVGQWDPGWQIFAADVNGDRRADLFLLNAAGLHVTALSRPGGDYLYINASQFSTGWSVFPGDFNHDGRADLFLYNPVNGIWVEALSNGFGGFTFPGAGQFDPGWTVGVTDLNADGRADLILSNAAGVFVQLTNTADGVFTASVGNWGTGWKVITRRLP
jgi:hypothetical protein